jgi:hypothetical protein
LSVDDDFLAEFAVLCQTITEDLPHCSPSSRPRTNPTDGAAPEPAAEAAIHVGPDQDRRAVHARRRAVSDLAWLRSTRAGALA